MSLFGSGNEFIRFPKDILLLEPLLEMIHLAASMCDFATLKPFNQELREMGDSSEYCFANTICTIIQFAQHDPAETNFLAPEDLFIVK
jgi:hypothetical protein